MKIKFKTKFILVRTAGLFFILFLMFANSGTVLAANDLYYGNPQITPAKMLGLTNQSRKESGLLALTVNQKLTSAAEAKASDMFEYQYFEHNSPSGVTPWDWIKGSGYSYRYAGENLAIDFVTAESAHKALMASDSHRDNILNQDYTEVGISVKKDVFEESESIIIVVEFGTPLQARVAYAGSNNNTNESVELFNETEPDNSKNDPDGNMNNAKKEPQRKAVDLSPAIISSDFKKDNEQNISKSIKKQRKKENSEDDVREDRGIRENSREGKKVVPSAGVTKFIGMSVENAEKISLEKVYTENIYWKKESKGNVNGQTTVMSSGGQSGSGFNSSIFYTCVLSIFFMFESLYLFSNFMMSGRFKTEEIQSGELDISLKL